MTASTTGIGEVLAMVFDEDSKRLDGQHLVEPTRLDEYQSSSGLGFNVFRRVIDRSSFASSVVMERDYRSHKSP